MKAILHTSICKIILAAAFFLAFANIGTAQITDDFTDGNFTANPVWSGDTGSYAVSTAATLPSGTAATDGFFLASNASTGNVTMTTPSAEASEWAFSLGSPTFAPSTANYIGVILMSNTAITGSVITSSWNGYYLRIGIDGATDPIELWKKAGATATKIGNFPTSANYGASALTAGLNIRVTRNPSGQFEVFYSTGFTYAATPTTSAGTLTDTTYSTSSFFGVFQFITNPAATRRVYIDNVVIGNPAGNVAPVASSVAFTGTPEVGQLLTGSYSYSDANGDPEGTSTFRWFRADDAAGLNEVAITGATASTYTLTSADLNKYISFGVTPIAATGTTNGAEAKSARQGAVTAVNNSLSTITADPGLTPAANVNYSSFTGTDVTGSSFEIARFLLNDVAGAPNDGLTTKLTALTFNLTSPSNIDKVALYDDANNEIQEITASATLNFTGLSIIAPSGGSKSFSVRVTFKTAVNDNAQPHLTISAATADAAGSLFAAANAGGAGSSIAGDDNKIEVTASALAYTTNATTAVLNAAMLPAVVVKAIDANNNLDLDFTSAVNITSTGTLSVSPVSVNAVAGVATFSSIIHTVAGFGFQLSAASGAFAPIGSNLFDVYNPIFANTITGTNPNLSNPYTTGQVTDANLTASGIGRGTGITGTNANDRYNANSWDTPSFDATQYFEFIITPNATKEIDFVNFIYTAQISSAGALTNYQVRSSVDNFATAIGTATAAVAPGALVTIDLSAAAYQNVATAITFRVYGWGAASGTSTFSINNFTFNGEVTNSSAPVITVSTASVNNLNYFVGSGPSASQSFTVSGGNLSPAADDLTVTAPADFEVSADNVTFGPTATISYTGGTVNAFPVYVRTIAGLGLGTHNGTVTVTGGTAPLKSLTVQGIIRVPFAIPYSNTFRTQALADDAVAQGFVISNTAFNPTGYEQISLNGYIETPTIDFTQLSTMQVAFAAATFGGNTGQTLQLQISTDNGGNYTPLATFALPSSTFVVYKTNIDFASYPSATGKLRVQMTAGTNTSRFRDFYIFNSTTWNGTAWSNGTPDAITIASIEGDYNSTANGPVTAKNLTVTTGDVVIASGDTMHLEDELTVNGGSVSFENNANLIQVNTATNTGNITIERDANIRRLDYVYWGSPVTNQQLLAFSPQTITTRFYEFNETTHAFAVVDPAITNFALGKGYSIRAPNDFTTAIQTFSGFFTGVPHNGTVNVAVTNTNQGFNLIANPYPSPISATAFAAANPTVGTLYFWTHTNQASASGANYATFNGTGAASPNGSAVPNGTIQTGQGFVVKIPSSQNVVFNNAMRTDNHQNQFFRDGNSDKSRLWLNLSNETEPFSQLLVGYIDGATNAVDVQFDGISLETEKSGLYSLIGESAYVIQGKALPFAATDIVPLGFKAITDGNFTIAMDHFDGLFADGQDIFLKDNLTGIIHNIKENPYTFATMAGTFNDRFAVVYQNTTLGVEQPSPDANSVVIYKQNNMLNINAGAVTMSDIKIFDIRGRMIYENNNVNAATASINLNAAQQVLVVQITSDDNKTVSKKVVF